MLLVCMCISLQIWNKLHILNVLEIRLLGLCKTLQYLDLATHLIQLLLAYCI